MANYIVLIKSPGSYYGRLFRGRYQVVQPPFPTSKAANDFIRENRKFDHMLGVAYRYRVKRVE